LRRQRSGGSWFEASLGKQFERHYLKKSTTKKSWWSGTHGIDPEFKPRTGKKKKGR
jgi:hypothetical protein